MRCTRPSAVPVFALLLGACTEAPPIVEAPTAFEPIEPVYTTPSVPGDPDDPAIWVHPDDPSQSLVLGTDKGLVGGVYVYDLEGRALPELHQLGLNQPNNVDIQTGVAFGGETIDIAVATERGAHQLRAWCLPEMTAIDGGGIPVFEGQSGFEREPTGVALYAPPDSDALFAIVSRAAGPSDGYLWTYRLEEQDGQLVASFERAFGRFSGRKDIESVVVDDRAGTVFYSDELTNIWKYPAHPDDPQAGEPLATFATSGFEVAREGMDLVETDPLNDDGTGWLLVSDQIGEEVHVYPREGADGDPDFHPLVGLFETAAVEVDGMDAVVLDFGGPFEEGLMVSHSDEGFFHYYRWADVLDRL
jgi:3-phytase